VPKLNNTIVKEECKHRVNKEKGKITVTLKKKTEQKWSDLTG